MILEGAAGIDQGSGDVVSAALGRHIRAVIMDIYRGADGSGSAGGRGELDGRVSAIRRGVNLTEGRGEGIVRHGDIQSIARVHMQSGFLHAVGRHKAVQQSADGIRRFLVGEPHIQHAILAVEFGGLVNHAACRESWRARIRNQRDGNRGADSGSSLRRSRSRREQKCGSANQYTDDNALKDFHRDPLLRRPARDFKLGSALARVHCCCLVKRNLKFPGERAQFAQFCPVEILLIGWRFLLPHGQGLQYTLSIGRFVYPSYSLENYGLRRMLPCEYF